MASSRALVAGTRPSALNDVLRPFPDALPAPAKHEALGPLGWSPSLRGNSQKRHSQLDPGNTGEFLAPAAGLFLKLHVSSLPLAQANQIIDRPRMAKRMVRWCCGPGLA